MFGYIMCKDEFNQFVNKVEIIKVNFELFFNLGMIVYNLNLNKLVLLIMFFKIINIWSN